MKRYKAEAPNKNYNGRTCGVRFEDGVAIFDDLTIRAEIGHNADEVAKILEKDHQYKVTLLADGGTQKASGNRASVAA